MDNLRKHISKFSHKERRSIMKKEIKAPEMEVITLLFEDVITTSSGNDGSTDLPDDEDL